MWWLRVQRVRDMWWLRVQRVRDVYVRYMRDVYVRYMRVDRVVELCRPHESMAKVGQGCNLYIIESCVLSCVVSVRVPRVWQRLAKAVIQ
jgi:hypothetical protein